MNCPICGKPESGDCNKKKCVHYRGVTLDGIYVRTPFNRTYELPSKFKLVLDKNKLLVYEVF
jgi:hypothetical protein